MSVSENKKTTKKTTRKAAPKEAGDITGPEVVENDVEHDDVDGGVKTLAQREAEDDKTPLTFTLEVNGRELEIEDRWTRDNPPGALMLMGSEEIGAKYIGMLAEQIIGHDQVIKILDAGGDTDEMSRAVHAWRRARGLGNG